MSRIPYPDLATIDPERLAILGYPKKQPLNITHVALHVADGLWRGHIALKQAVVNATTMDPWLREVLIMRVAALAKCEYELHHHISISANLGFTPEQQQAILGQDYAILTEEERAVAEFTDEVVTLLAPTDATFNKARDLFGDALICEMTVIIASYWGTAMMIGVTGVEPDHAPVVSWAEDEKD